MTIMREVVNGGDSPVVKHVTRAIGTRDRKGMGKQVSSGRSPCIRERSGSKDVMLQ